MIIKRSHFVFQICLFILFIGVGMYAGATSWSLPALLFYVNFYIGCAFYFKCIYDRDVTIWMLHWFFYLIFFAIFPAAQWILNLWEHSPSYDEVVKANLIILEYGILYLFGYLVAFQTRQSQRLIDISDSRKNSSANLLFIGALLFLLSIVAVFIFGEILIFKTSEIIGQWGPGRLIFQFFIQPLLFFLFYISLFYEVVNKLVKKRLIVLLFLALQAFIFNFPLGSARFYIFTIYFPVIIITISYLLDRKYHGVAYTLVILPLLIFGSFLVQVATGRLQLSLLFDYIFSGNFDSYENFVHIVAFTDELGVRPSQFFGAFLFFIPRDLIDTKVIGTGAFLVSEYFGNGPTNISMPLLGEFYLAFSNIGIIFLAFSLGLCSGYLDVRAKKIHDIFINLSDRNIYSKQDEEINIINFFCGYYIIISFSLILYRGDLMTVVSSAGGLFLAFLAARLIVRKKCWL